MSRGPARYLINHNNEEKEHQGKSFDQEGFAGREDKAIQSGWAISAEVYDLVTPVQSQVWFLWRSSR